MASAMNPASAKVRWSGIVRAIQSRARVWRYRTDNRTHYHVGLNVWLECMRAMSRASSAWPSQARKSGSSGSGLATLLPEPRRLSRTARSPPVNALQKRIG